MPWSKRLAEAEVDAEVPNCLHWDPEDAAAWVTQLGFPQYAACFTDNFVSGRKLILLDSRRLIQIGITDYEHIKTLRLALQTLLRQPPDVRTRSIAEPPRDPMGTFLLIKTRTGRRADTLNYSTYLKQNKLHGRR